MKIIILLFGIAVSIIGAQDLVRIVLNPQDPGLWGGFTDEYAARIILNVILIVAGIFDATILRQKIK